MRIQEAAHNILEEFGKPLGSREIAKIALERRMVISNAKDPVFSHATSIEKNIREDVYNKPRLIFVRGPKGRLIGLPSWESKSIQFPDSHSKSIEYMELRARIPADLLEKVQLARQAKLADSFDEMVAILLKKGLSAVAADIKKGLLHQLDQFDMLGG
jgi:HB1, ASXL, restriction endonuclease HTH domain